MVEKLIFQLLNVSFTVLFMIFSQSITTWYHQNKRSLPWRSTSDPYAIWISEVIMQQTQVAQGTNYYLRFMKRFPTVEELALAEQDDVLKLWEGLGYYSRARNLHAGAQQIWHDWDGKMPTSYKDLLTIKGIGPYTAAAISSICFNEKQAVVDGNVFRVLSRVFGIHTPINSTSGKKEFESLAKQLIEDAVHNGDHNQAVMEFGALHCRPKNPECDACIFQHSCQAYKQDLISELPVKTKAKPQRKRYFNFMIFKEDNLIAIEKRSENDIWRGLYQFPLRETDHILKTINNAVDLNYELTHLLSHQRLIIKVWQVKDKSMLNGQHIMVPLKDINKYAFPVPLKRFIDSKLLHLPPRPQ